MQRFLSLYSVLIYRVIDSYLNTIATFIILYSVLIYRVIDSYLITNATFLSLYSVLIYRVIDLYSSTNVMLLFSFFNTIMQCNTIQYTFIQQFKNIVLKYIFKCICVRVVKNKHEHIINALASCVQISYNQLIRAFNYLTMTYKHISKHAMQNFIIFSFYLCVATINCAL